MNISRTIVMSLELLNDLEGLAKQRDVSVSKLVRKILEAEVARLKALEPDNRLPLTP